MAGRSKPLVCEYLENISRTALEKHRALIKDYVKGKKGVYALYRGDRLKYVGLATNLRGRLNTHLKDRHAQSWDKFSVYLTLTDDHLRELEALVIRIAAPKENRMKMKFAKAENVLKRFKRDIVCFQKKELQEMIGQDENETDNLLKESKIKKSRSIREHPKSAYGKSPYKSSAKTRNELKEKSRYGHQVGTVCAHLDEMIFEGTNREKMVKSIMKKFPDRYAGDSAEKKAYKMVCSYLHYLKKKGIIIIKKDGIIKAKQKSLGDRGEHKRNKSEEKIKPKATALSAHVKYRWFKIRADYKEQRHYATVSADGKIKYKSQLFNSPSTAGMAVTNRPMDGWKFWKYKNDQGEWVYIDELRKGR